MDCLKHSIPVRSVVESWRPDSEYESVGPDDPGTRDWLGSF